MIVRLIGSASFVALALIAGQVQAQTQAAQPISAISLAPSAAAGKINVTSGAFKPGGTIPEIFTQNGQNISPPLAWSKGPKGTASYVLLTEDLGGNRPDPTSHWVIYDIPASVTALRQAVPADARLAAPAGALQGLNVRKAAGYVGPKPPMGVTHPYHFEVFALDEKLGLDPAAADRKAVVAAMAGHILAAGEIVANYQTPQPAYDRHDLTGVWMQNGGGTRGKDVSFTPEYAKIFQLHAEAKKAGNPYRHDQGLCVPAGIVGDMTEGFAAIEILARGDSELLLNKEAPNALYRIFLKRQHKPADELSPTFYGDSVGHWEGDVLVVDTIGLEGGYWLDSQFEHVPYSNELHFTQHLERVTYDTIQNHITAEDPKAFAKPYTATATYKLHPDWELTEAICTNERNVVNENGQPTVRSSEITK